MCPINMFFWQILQIAGARISIVWMLLVISNLTDKSKKSEDWKCESEISFCKCDFIWSVQSWTSAVHAVKAWTACVSDIVLYDFYATSGFSAFYF